MYFLINQHVKNLLNLPAMAKHIADYSWLLGKLQGEEIDKCDEFKTKYKAFWSMNVARLSDSYMDAYFSFLQNHKLGNPRLCVAEVARDLYNVPTGANGKRTLQFSFASKLVHMISPTLPIYDQMVERFYFFPTGNVSGLKRLPLLMKSYDFLKVEHRRIIAGQLLREGIDACRERFRDVEMTDEKIIDSLIWHFVDRLQKGAITDQQIAYA